MKKYDTGKSKWNHGEPTDYEHGYGYTRILLGPCPDCGAPTFNYGGGWRCMAMYCSRNTSNPAPNVGPKPTWWNTDINVKLDGNAWCAYRDGFIDLQESVAGFGDTPQKAVEELLKSGRNDSA